MISVLIFGFLCWSSSWWWRPHIAGCKLCWTPLRARMAVLDQFFCKMYFLYVWQERKQNVVHFFLGFSPPKETFFSWGSNVRIEVQMSELRWREEIVMKSLASYMQWSNVIIEVQMSELRWRDFTPAYRGLPPYTLSQHPDSREIG